MRINITFVENYVLSAQDTLVTLYAPIFVLNQPIQIMVDDGKVRIMVGFD